MDCSWLHDGDDADNPVSESDPEEDQSELEARLYAIVHHNDLSQPLPPELAKHYSVDSTDDGEVVVILKNSLEEVKSEETKVIDHILKNHESNSEDPNLEVIEILDDDNSSVPNFPKNSNRRFRYSNVNIDEINESQKDEKFESSASKINYFKLGPGFFSSERNKQFTDITIPSHYNSPDWKTDANASFISVGLNESMQDSDKLILQNMVKALIKLNPNEKRKRLNILARRIFKRNKAAQKRKEKRRRKSEKYPTTVKFDTTIDFLNNTQNGLLEDKVKDNVINYKKNTQRRKNAANLSGSITLNISPFKPSPVEVDLVSEDPDNSTFTEDFQENLASFKELSKKHIPTKWTKAMIKFYTKLSKKKKKLNLDSIFENFRNTTTSADWRLDPRDKGFYHKSPQFKPNPKCTNCRERGHTVKLCPRPMIIPTCNLCGQYYHSDYSCPNSVCMKCGVFLSPGQYECSDCYYHAYEYNSPCDFCGNFLHRSDICPDKWRSFHATVEGDKVIPKEVLSNKRKYCCNCSRKGHFSHDCPFLMYSGQQTTVFVSNYTASPEVIGTANIVVSEDHSTFMDNEDTDIFLQNLSNSTNAFIQMNQECKTLIFNVSGTFEQCSQVRMEIESYVNTKKRKRQEPSPPRKKRQRMKL